MNLLNAEAVDKFVRRIVRKEYRDTHIGKWYASTFRRYLLNDPARAVQLVSAAEANSVVFKTTQAIAAKLKVPVPPWKVVEQDMILDESWQVEALAKNDLYEWIVPTDDEANLFAHWQEFMAKLPPRQIRHTVPDMIAAVAHDDAVAKLADIAATADGFEVVDFQFSDPSVYLVRLESRGSFAAESAAMDHCVGRASRYFADRRKNPIYSLRVVDAKSPLLRQRVDGAPKDLLTLATIELSLAQKIVVQANGYKNRALSNEVSKQLNEWIVAEGLTAAEYEDEDDYVWPRGIRCPRPGGGTPPSTAGQRPAATRGELCTFVALCLTIPAAATRFVPCQDPPRP